jgi:hypothetical protein
MKDDEMGGVCNTHGREHKFVEVWLENLKKNNLEDLDVDGRIILKSIISTMGRRRLVKLALNKH